MITTKEYPDRKEWLLDGVRHREDGPAIEFVDGTKEWFWNGLLHRLDGPALEYVNGNKIWCQNGQIHREDGPAQEYANGDKVWTQHSKMHRENGPAIEHLDGYNAWYRHGIIHRIDGPARTYSNGKVEWWIKCDHSFEGKKWNLFDYPLTEIEIKNYQISRIKDLTLALLPLGLPPYIIFWILEWSESAYIFELNPRTIIAMIEGLRNSRDKIKTKGQ